MMDYSANKDQQLEYKINENNLNQKAQQGAIIYRMKC